MYFLKFNSETLENFRKFKALVESKVGYALKLFVQIEVASLHKMNSIFFVKKVAFVEN